MNSKSVSARILRETSTALQRAKLVIAGIMLALTLMKTVGIQIHMRRGSVMKPCDLIVAMSLLALVSCSDRGSDLQLRPSLLSIDLQGGFSNDSIRVTVDGRVVFDGRATTNDILFLAHTFRLDVSRGRHTVLVQNLNPFWITENDTTVTLTDTLTVAVNLDERSRSPVFTIHPFLIPYR
jgi:hypothetical protein